MVVTAVALAVLSILLADPIPRLLSKARWTWRDPVGGLILWQSIGLAAGLALCGCFLVLGLGNLGPSLPESLITFWRDVANGEPLRGIDAANAACLLIAAALALRLFWTLVRSVRRVLAVRRTQRDALDVLATPWPNDAGVLVLDHPSAVAYCLPGNKSRLVISSGATESLTHDELNAVLTHERAHLSHRHDLVVLPFVAWGAALPFSVGVRRAQANVALLVEMMADDAAVQTGQADALIAALDRMRPASVRNLGGLDHDIASDVRRQRLQNPSRGTTRLRLVSVAAGALLLLVPTLVIVVPAFV